MKVTLKIRGEVLDEIRRDLIRPHAFAHERVGFLTAGAVGMGEDLMMLVRDYQPVADEDYEFDPRVGARIGSNAMRKAVQSAYRPAATLLHVHTHGGRGRPAFSHVDLASAADFVPGFFETTPRMPHGLLVLSDDDASGILWTDGKRTRSEIDLFIRTDAPLKRTWGTQ
ncbi:hypothetical protein [Brevundimonas sp.]|uniref:hypothetical protein n=1 Tax=Brevundimonas sp. TaxID=1871086 RepID=UPI003D142039